MYKIFVSATADHQLRRLDFPQRQRITVAIRKLVKKLVGQEGYRLRVGDLRILYSIDDKEMMILIHEVGKRGDIY